jgi:hypothetical protein
MHDTTNIYDWGNSLAEHCYWMEARNVRVQSRNSAYMRKANIRIERNYRGARSAHSGEKSVSTSGGG